MSKPVYPVGVEYCHLINSSKDLQSTQYSHIDRDYTVLSRAAFRLLCRRGQWLYDPNMGSLLYTLKTDKDARANAAKYVQQALQPMIDEGSIALVETSPVEFDSNYGMNKIEVFITPTEGDRVSLGEFRIGS